MLQILQRCSAYGFWPESRVVKSNPLQLPLPEPTRACVVIRAYKPRIDYYAPAEQLSGPEVPVMAGISRNFGFWIGNAQLAPNQAGSTVAQLEPVLPQAGDLDMSIECIGEVNPELASGHLTACIRVATALLVFLSGDVVKLKGPPRIIVSDDHGSREISPSQDHVQLIDRPIVTEDRLKQIMSAVCTITPRLSLEQRYRMDKAIQRYFSALHETDMIDKFSDFWEACEFLHPKNDPFKGKIDERIVQSLAKLTGLNPVRIKKEFVGWIYDVRGDLVHNAVEDATRVRLATILLEDAVKRFLVAQLNLSTTGPGQIERFIADPVAFRRESGLI